MQQTGVVEGRWVLDTGDRAQESAQRCGDRSDGADRICGARRDNLCP